MTRMEEAIRGRRWSSAPSEAMDRLQRRRKGLVRRRREREGRNCDDSDGKRRERADQGSCGFAGERKWKVTAKVKAQL